MSDQSEVKSDTENQSASKLQRVKTPLGFDLLLDPGDYFSRLFMRDGVFEAPESDLISRLVHSDDTCIDAGSHVGYYTCLLGRLVGKKGHVYAFDANPEACEAAKRNLSLNGLDWAEVIHTALADHEGSLPFYVSSDDQTGLSSLGSIPNFKKILHVPCSRLDTFLDSRRVEHIRLLKIDVEGSEEMLLSGLGRFLTGQLMDFILLELYDERLRGLNTSTEKVEGILQRAGYRAWTYESASGWLVARQVQSRGDCNYLFVSPRVQETIPAFTLAPAFSQMQVTLSREREAFHAREQETQGLRREMESLQQETKRLQEAAVHLQERLFAIENSAGWRALNFYRKFRRYFGFGKNSAA